MTNSSSSPSLMTRLMQITHGSHHHNQHHPSPGLQSIPSGASLVLESNSHGVQSSTDGSLMTSRDEDAVIDSSFSVGHPLPPGPSLSISQSESDQATKSPRKVPSSSCLSTHGSTEQVMVNKSTSGGDLRRSPVVITVGSNESNGSGPGSNCSSKNVTSKNVATSQSSYRVTKMNKEFGSSSIPSRRSRRKSEWEILEGLKEGQTHEQVPDKFEGWMLKRRKWPLKGWHKRWFVIENGVLSYTKNPGDILRGKVHGSVDVGLSVISTKLSSKRIDIDAEEFIYHIKCKNKSAFANWVAQLRVHRLYRQHQIAFGSKVNPNGSTSGSPTSVVGYCNIGSPSNDHKVANWILDSSHVSFDSMYKELNEYQVKLVELSSILQVIESQAGSRAELLDEKETRSAKKGGRRRFLPLGRHKKQQSVTVPPSSGVTNYSTPAVTQQPKAKNKGGQQIDTASSSAASNNLNVVTHGNVMPHVRSESALSMHHDSSDQDSVPSSCASFTIGQTGAPHFTFNCDPQLQSHNVDTCGATSHSTLSTHSTNQGTKLSGSNKPRYQLSVDQAGQSTSLSKFPSKGGSSAKPWEDFIATASESKFIGLLVSESVSSVK